MIGSSERLGILPGGYFDQLSEPARPDPASVDIVHARDHKFKKRKDGKSNCEVCGGGRSNMAHIGTPASLNMMGSRSTNFAFFRAKEAWQNRLAELIDKSGLPRGLGSVLAEGQMVFPDRQRRDCGNYKFLIEKALGDALVQGGKDVPGGWLADDDWTRFDFGRLRYGYSKGDAITALTLHPSWSPLTGQGE